MSRRQPSGQAPRRRLHEIVTLCVTNAIKLVGLYVMVHEVATQPQPRLVEIAAALFMMTGAEVSEEAIVKLVNRMFGLHGEDERRRR